MSAKTALRSAGMAGVAGTAGRAIDEAQARRTAAALGFTHFLALTEGVSLSAALALPGRRALPRSGIYLHAFAAGRYYIGQAIDIVRRMRQHREYGLTPEWLAFCPAPPERLDELERTFLRRAAEVRLPLTNRQLFDDEPLTEPDAAFDDCFSPELQDAFVAQAGAHGTTRAERLAELIRESTPQDAEAWERFSLHPLSRSMMALTSRYIHAAIPKPLAFEDCWWRLSLRSHRQRRAERSMAEVTCGLCKTFELRNVPGQREVILCEARLAGRLAGSSAPSAVRLRDEFPHARWILPDREAFAKLPDSTFSPVQGCVYASKDARREDLAREVTLASFYPPARIICSMDDMVRLLSMPAAMRALSAEAIACMRRKCGMLPQFHNRLAARIAVEEIF